LTPVSFDFKKRLGAGHFGEVWLVIDTCLNVTRALKLIPPTKVLDPNNVFAEAQILKAVEHANIVKVEEAGYLEDGRIYVAMEYLPKGSLEDETKGSYVDLTRAQRIMGDALRGLQKAHETGILHRDIKPANILIGDLNEGRLSDFGLAIPKNTNLRSLGVKDYAYVLHLAPEVIVKTDYSVRSDIYAAGVTLYRLINGDSYLPAVSDAELASAILNREYPNRTHYREFIPRPLRTLVNRAIEVAPAKRFATADEMRHALERIPFKMNWNEQRLGNGFRWSSGWNGRCYEVTRVVQSDRTWSVQTRKGPSANALRRINRLCAHSLSKAEAERMTRRILQDYVLGRLS
jgi:serine/threonine protein kinase